MFSSQGLRRAIEDLFSCADYFDCVGNFRPENGGRPAVVDGKTVARVSQLWPPRGVRDESTIALSDSKGTEHALESNPQGQRYAPPAVGLVDVKMQVGGIAGMLRLLAIPVGQQPANKPPAPRMVPVPATGQAKEHSAGRLEPGIEEERLKIRANRPQQIPDYPAVDLCDQRPLALVLELGFGEQVSKELSIAEDWVDRLSEETCLAAKPPNGATVAGLILPDEQPFQRRQHTALGR